MATLNIKIKSSTQELTKILLANHYENDKSYYKLDIYMIPEEIDILKIDDLFMLDNYAIIQDLNGLNKQVINKEGSVIKSSKVENVIAIKELLEKLNYSELMYINYDVYCFSKNDKTIKVKNILKQGLFLEGDEDILNLLKENNILYDSSNYFVSNEKIALVNIQEEIKKNMK